MTTVSLRHRTLPDATLSIEEGVYTYTITGFSDLDEFPRELTIEEIGVGILSVNPPTVESTDKRWLETLMVRAIEISMPVGTLDNEEANGEPVYHNGHYLLSHITRLTRKLLLKMEPLS